VSGCTDWGLLMLKGTVAVDYALQDQLTAANLIIHGVRCGIYLIDPQQVEVTKVQVSTHVDVMMTWWSWL